MEAPQPIFEASVSKISGVVSAKKKRGLINIRLALYHTRIWQVLSNKATR